ncbi:putative major facilitator superfamily transporter [Neohortaea acidophila]|uniref:Putative major facilitator superfamily transporter n=1 Tax=Neohortaea acidophila TaxID=245834 RepID=A0A6A6PJB0_9PEZI|nr:putative major facilitator superfamily transporter [Neohortaea acidophila]KAF2480130.1 putative major facilitator superfamily transporter [Neohortaea acidophila]
MDERQPLLDPPHERHGRDHSNGKDHFVDFDPEGDQDNPLEWSKRYRWFIVLLLAFMAMTVTFTCIGIVPVAGAVVKDLEGHRDKSASVLLVTIWELGEAAGPLFIAPLSEIFGRWPTYNAANALFVVGILISVFSQSIDLLIFSRFLTGCAVATNVLNPAIVGDMFPSENRGSAMAAMMLAPLIGGAMGPTVAGGLAQATGWREVLWLAIGLAGVCELAFILFFRETYKPTILRRRAARLRRETGDDGYKTAFDREGTDSSTMTVLKAMARPAKVIYSSSLLQILSIWGALVFAMFYVFSTSLPDMLQDLYDFSPALTGVSFLTFSAGSICGIAICNFVSDWLYIKLEKKHGGRSYPEGRLPLSILGAFFTPLVMFLYGWSADRHWPVWVLLVSVVFVGLVVVTSIVPMMTYITDAFGLYSASALTAVLILRCLAGSFLPLAMPPLTNLVGIGWGFSIIAATLLATAPIPALVMRYGPRWRQRSNYTMEP